MSVSNLAWSDNEFYAKINVNGQLSDEGEGSFSEIRSNNSWLGVKGTLPLDNELYAVYRLEWKVDITGEAGVDTFTARPQYVGLGGSFGELTLGRNFTALWMAQGKIDLFNHYEGDIKTLFKGENRLPDVATYTSPSYNNVKFVITYQAEKSETGKSATSAGIFYGDKYLKSNNLFAALAQDFDVKGYDVTRGSLHYKFDKNKIGVILQRQEPGDGGDSESGATISYERNLGKYALRAQYQTMEDDSLFNIGVDYKVGNSTKVYTWYSSSDREDSEDKQYFALGFEHKLSYKF